MLISILLLTSWSVNGDNTPHNLGPTGLKFYSVFDGANLCLSQTPNITKDDIITIKDCAIVCLNVNDCLRFQFNKRLSICDIFTAWQVVYLYQKISGCQMFDRSDLCPRGFIYVSHLNSCYYLLSGERTWEESRSVCNALPGVVYPAVVTTQQEKTFIDSYLNFSYVTLPECFTVEYNSYKVWLGGQRIEPDDETSPFIWKPFPNGPSLSFNTTFWQRGQPDRIALLESCLSFWNTRRFLWNNSNCTFLKCVMCEADPFSQ